VGGGGGALGAFSEGFEWANAELPVSLFPAGNQPDEPSQPEDDGSGVRRWLALARRAARRKKVARPNAGETGEEANNLTVCAEGEDHTAEDADCVEPCGLVNGVHLLDKGIVISTSLIAVFCFRSLAQLIVTKCARRDPWDALLFPNWEGPLLLVHWFGMCDSLTTTLGRPCPLWLTVTCACIFFGPIMFLIYAFWQVISPVRPSCLVPPRFLTTFSCRSRRSHGM
jgi:hypothetical protein